MIDNRNINPSFEEDKKILEAFLANPENKRAAISLAHQIHKETDGEWFLIKKLMKLFDVTVGEIKNKLTVMGAFNLVAYKEEQGKQYYRIDLDHKIQRSLVLQEIEFHKAQIEILQEKLLRLN